MRRGGARWWWGCLVLVACGGAEGRGDPVAQTSTGVAPTSSAATDTTTGDPGSDGPGATSVATGTTGSVADETAGGEGPVFDLGIMPDAPPPEACLRCEIALSTTQSNALHTTAGMPLFVSAELAGDVVFGLADADAGRLAFSGDGNVIYREGTCPLWEWLGATGVAPPRVLCIGAEWPCSGLTGGEPPLEINALHEYPGQLDYGGLTLPPAYENDPVALHTDYDVVAYFAVLDFATGGWDADPGDAATLEAFVREQGGGLYLIAEYWQGGMQQPQLDSLNALSAPFDVEYEQQSLAWGPAGAQVMLECFPVPAG